MAKRQKPILHARDHMAGGADPIPIRLVDGPVGDVIFATYPGAYYKMNEATGDWEDSSGNDRTLDYVSNGSTSRAQDSPLDEGDGGKAVHVVGGAPGPAMSASNVALFDPIVSDDYFAFAGTADMTVSVLVNIDGFSPSWSQGILGNVDVEIAPAGDKSGWGMYVLSELHDPDPVPVARAGKVCFRRYMNSGDYQEAVTPDPVVDGAWIRITAVYGGSLLGGNKLVDLWIGNEFWADSGTFNFTSLPGDANKSRFRIGDCGIAEGFGGNMAPFNGLVDSVVVWDRPLTPGEIGGIIAAGGEGLVLTTDGAGGTSFQKPKIEVEY